MTDMNASRAVVPTLDMDNEWLTVAAFDVEYDSPFWLAPQIYTGNRVSSYGSNLTYSVTWVVMRGDTSGKPTTQPNVILVVNIRSRIFPSTFNPSPRKKIDIYIITYNSRTREG